MDYEKKYKESFERARKFKNGEIERELEIGENIMEYVFPELKESEDDIIKKQIINYFKCQSRDEPSRKDIHNKWIAWLEKQGEPIDKIVERAMNEKQRVLLTETNGDANIDWNTRSLQDVKLLLEYGLNYIKKLEKQGEQKAFNYESANIPQKDFAPKSAMEAIKEEKVDNANKVEPKFEVRDWVVNTITGNVEQIIAVTSNEYVCSGTLIVSFDNQHLMKKWTIQDAKDGDVLVASDGSIFLFKDTIDCACRYYAALTTDGTVKFNKGLEHFWETSRAVHPTTKEQREQLEKAMADAGYTFNFEKKELKKIEQKSATMSLDEAIEHCKEKSCGNNACALEHKQLKKWLTELKELKEQKPAWNEEDDENIMMIENRFSDYLDYIREDSSRTKHRKNTLKEDVIGCVNWLKSLKERVQPQPKQEWSEEDEKRVENILSVLNVQECWNGATGKKEQPYQREIDWLKSLKPQNTWKPSDEQMDALNDACDGEEYDKQILYNLYKQLKKLKED